VEIAGLDMPNYVVYKYIKFDSSRGVGDEGRWFAWMLLRSGVFWSILSLFSK
jgi:hypothetical protein